MKRYLWDWGDFGQKYFIFVAPAFCMVEDEETF